MPQRDEVGIVNSALARYTIGTVVTPVETPRPAGEQPSVSAEDEPTDARGLEGQVLAERYRLEVLLGEGGMGAVYRAQHVHMHKTVAVKVLHPEMTAFPEAVARFEREAVACARIEHPNVAAATDFGRLPDGSFYLVLEYVEGRSLRSLLHARNGPLPPASCIRIARQIASALNAAHGQGIVHRDLKPENVMLVDRAGETEFVKVLDFGIAKVAMDKSDQPALTRLGAVFGTPDYMSPEQALGKAVDLRSDLYSLGIMIYEMASGRRPFDADEAVTVLSAQIGKAPPPLPDHVHPRLASLIRTLLAKAPDDRYQTATEVVKGLDEIGALPGIATSLHLSVPMVSSSPSIEISESDSHHVVVTAIGSRSVVSSESSMTGGDLGQGPVSGVVPTALALPKVDRGDHPITAPILATARQSPASKQAATALGAPPWWEPLKQAAPFLFRPVRLGKIEIPTWSLGAVPIALLFGLIFLVVVISLLVRPAPKAMTRALTDLTSLAPPPSDGPSRTSPPPREVNADDIQRIEGTPVYKRKLEDWMDLGRGYASQGKSRDSVLSYRAALQLDKAQRNDPQMLADLRQGAQSPDAYGLVVNICEGGRRGLGDSGFELLWDLWAGFQSNTEQQGYAESTLKKLVILSRRMSPALRVAVELQASNGCETLSGLLDRAAKYGDERSAARLHQLEQTTGCGVDKSEDCYRCLRSSEALASAIKGAESRPAPRIERGYR